MGIQKMAISVTMRRALKQRAALVLDNFVAAVQSELAAPTPTVRIYGGGQQQAVPTLDLTKPQVDSPNFGLRIAEVHPYSEIWNLVEIDPNRWH